MRPMKVLVGAALLGSTVSTVAIADATPIPPVAQAVWLNDHGSPRYAATTRGKKHNIAVNSDREMSGGLPTG
jgi:hypothetical protein